MNYNKPKPVIPDDPKPSIIDNPKPVLPDDPPPKPGHEILGDSKS